MWVKVRPDTGAITNSFPWSKQVLVPSASNAPLELGTGCMELVSCLYYVHEKLFHNTNLSNLHVQEYYTQTIYLLHRFASTAKCREYNERT